MHQIFLLREFVRRDFESRYAGSMLGVFWSLVQPAWQLLLFTFVFSTVLKISCWASGPAISGSSSSAA